MIVVKESTGEFYGDDGFRGLFPNKSFPSVLTKDIVKEHGFDLVVESQPQPGQTTYRIQRTDGGWKQVWDADTTPVSDKIEIIKKRVGMRIKMSLDAVARSQGYDDVVTAVSYKDSTNPQFSADAARLISLRDSYWVAAIDVFKSIVRDDLDDIDKTVAKKFDQICDKVKVA